MNESQYRKATSRFQWAHRTLQRGLERLEDLRLKVRQTPRAVEIENMQKTTLKFLDALFLQKMKWQKAYQTRKATNLPNWPIAPLARFRLSNANLRGFTYEPLAINANATKSVFAPDVARAMDALGARYSAMAAQIPQPKRRWVSRVRGIFRRNPRAQQQQTIPSTTTPYTSAMSRQATPSPSNASSAPFVSARSGTRGASQTPFVSARSTAGRTLARASAPPVWFSAQPGGALGQVGRISAPLARASSPPGRTSAPPGRAPARSGRRVSTPFASARSRQLTPFPSTPFASARSRGGGPSSTAIFSRGATPSRRKSAAVF